MGDLNKAMLIGRLGRDPEIRQLGDGRRLVNLSVATAERWRDKATGEVRSRTEWHRVVIFNERIAGVAEKWTKKGTLVYVEGMIKTRKWADQTGAERYSTEIVVPDFGGALVLLDRAGGDGGAQEAPAEKAHGPVPSAHELDDDIPF